MRRFASTVAGLAVLAVSVSGCGKNDPGTKDTGQTGADTSSQETSAVDAEVTGTVYYTVDDGEATQLYSLTAGGEPTPELSMPDAGHVTMSPDGRHVTWLQADAEGGTTQELRVHDLETEETRTLMEYTVTGHSIYTEPLWSPDGRPSLLVQPEAGGDITWYHFDIDTHSDPLTYPGNWFIPVPTGDDGYHYYGWNSETGTVEYVDAAGKTETTGLRQDQLFAQDLNFEIRGLTATDGRTACLKATSGDDNGSGLGPESSCDMIFDLKTGDPLGERENRQLRYNMDGTVFSYYPADDPRIEIQDSDLKVIASSAVPADLGTVLAYVP